MKYGRNIMKRKIISTVLIAGMVMTGCAATETPEATTASATEAAGETTTAAETSEETQADVVVVGAGATGVSAALTAQQNGANVILLEKAADTMNLHLNTVKYRINQLEKTFGIDFTKMDAIYVSLAAAKIWIG
ncbi:MAG: helix-turn-helix domain-containing protein [Oribacterium sp.]|nr:helix-turn-helix domain-containing protein [Oribacterium sp.]